MFEVIPYKDAYREQVLLTWESSVRATHSFLSSTDFEEIKEAVGGINFNEFPVFCLINQGRVIGFLGVSDKKIEMLFLDPEFFGMGLGRRLLDFAVDNLGADYVDVNEQNERAVKFYEKFGFKTFERTEKDDQGRNYPLLRMKLSRERG